MSANILSNNIDCAECDRYAKVVAPSDCPECLRYAHQSTHKEYVKDCPYCQKYAQEDPRIGVIPDGNKDAHKKVFPDTYHDPQSLNAEGHRHGPVRETVVPGTHHVKVIEKREDTKKYDKYDKHGNVVVDKHDETVVVEKHGKHDKHDDVVVVDKHGKRVKNEDVVVVEKDGKHDKHDDVVVVDKHGKRDKNEDIVVVEKDGKHDKHSKDEEIVILDNHREKVNKDKHGDTYKETPDSQHGLKPDKDSGSRSAIPTPHDNKEVPGRHHEIVHPEDYDSKKAHPDLKTEIRTDVVDSKGKVIESYREKIIQEAPRDIINETQANAHHTTYAQTVGIAGSLGGLTSVRQDIEVIKANTEKLLGMDAFSGHDRDAKQRLLNDTIALISQHNVACEVVLYRAIKKIDKNKAKIASNQTIEVEKLLYDIDQDYGTQVDKPKFYDRFQALDTLLMKHVADDEREILSVLEHHYTPENLRSLNSWFDKIKKLAPTKPHPKGPHAAAVELSKGPALPFVDQMRDGGKKFTF
jgi:hypothetical protein